MYLSLCFARVLLFASMRFIVHVCVDCMRVLFYCVCLLVCACMLDVCVVVFVCLCCKVALHIARVSRLSVCFDFVISVCLLVLV